MTVAPLLLDEQTLAAGMLELAARDEGLAQVLADLGAPPLWAREPGFPTLVHIILEQQVSLASARAAFIRLCACASPLTPASFLRLDEDTLRNAGFSRQKAGYSRYLAQSILDGRLDLDALAYQEDADARAALLALKGIGPWTADIYLLMALRRPDVWPAGDLALQIAMQRVKRLATRPTPAEMETLAEPWRPWRAVAARVLWHRYLQGAK
jgi:DNA-3-methyladenine glycosylase II